MKPRDVRTRGAYDRSAHRYPPQLLTQAAWRAGTSTEMERLARALPHGKHRTSILRRATALRECGKYVQIRVCGGCTAPRAGCAVQCSRDGAQPCRTRVCSVCARRRAQENRHTLKAIFSQLPRVSEFRMRLITIQVAYDPKSEEDVSVESLRNRAVRLIDAIRWVWRGMHNVKGARGRSVKMAGVGMFWAVEIAASGFVHLHAVHYGPFINKADFEKRLQSRYAQIGRSHIKEIAADVDDEVHAILEVAKYLCKAPSPLSEGWAGGERRQATHPIIAGRWEVAVAKLHLQGKLGSFHGRKGEEPLPENAEVEDHHTLVDDAQVACACCGTIGDFHTVRVPTIEFVAFCHEQGERAFAGSRWDAESAGARSGGVGAPETHGKRKAFRGAVVGRFRRQLALREAPA